ncbi:MAG TPA: RNA polymerase subunit sigma [Planctomycetaceae bacterium]|nr:RNA polymerase subunit sigma [Planctomycetaceae bacterium]
MAGIPDTRHSLIARLPLASKGDADQAAWIEFAESYEPFLYGFARRNGMQHSDAQELVQLVLVSVSRSIADWEPPGPESGRPRFRTWLRTIAKNHLINQLKRRGRQPSSGGTSNLRRIDQQATAELTDDELSDAQYRREVFRHCASQVKTQVAQSTWQAFWLTAVEGQTCETVADRLGLRIGSVYAARARVLAKLKSQTARLLKEEELNDRDLTHHGASSQLGEQS